MAELSAKEDIKIRIRILNELIKYLTIQNTSPENSRAAENFRKLINIGEFLLTNEYALNNEKDNYKKLISDYKNTIFLKKNEPLENLENYEHEIDLLEKKCVQNYGKEKYVVAPNNEKVVIFTDTGKPRINLESNPLGADIVNMDSYRLKKVLLKKIGAVLSSIKFIPNEMLLNKIANQISSDTKRIIHNLLDKLEKLCKELERKAQVMDNDANMISNSIDKLLDEIHITCEDIRRHLQNKQELKMLKNADIELATIFFKNEIEQVDVLVKKCESILNDMEPEEEHIK